MADYYDKQAIIELAAMAIEDANGDLLRATRIIRDVFPVISFGVAAELVKLAHRTKARP